MRRDIGLTLYMSEQHEDAIKYLESARSAAEEPDEELTLALGQCYTYLGKYPEAIRLLESVLEIDGQNINARMLLAELYEEIGETKRAFAFVSEVIRIRKYSGTIGPSPYRQGRRKGVDRDSIEGRTSKPQALTKEEKEELDRMRGQAVRETYRTLKVVEDSMKHGLEGSIDAWMQAALALIADFRNTRVFYPLDKFHKFLGYSKEARKALYGSKADQDDYLARMTERLGNDSGAYESLIDGTDFD